MIKATATQENGRELLLLGLSFKNLEKFRELPLDTFIRINGIELGLSVDVVIFSGENEDALMQWAQQTFKIADFQDKQKKRPAVSRPRC